MMEDHGELHLKATFRAFNITQIEEFVQKVVKARYLKVSKVRFVDQIYTDPSTDDPKQEYEFIAIFELGRSRQQNYSNIVQAIRELALFFDKFTDELQYFGLSKSASVSISILSQDVYPRKFELRSICSINSFYLGNIVERSKFLPTLFFNAPNNQDNNVNLLTDFMLYCKEEPGIEWSMVGLFEHDREYMNILFPDVYHKHGRDRYPQVIQRIVELQTKYSAIRRCMITFGKESECGFFVNLTFHLLSPMIVYIYQINERDENNEGKFRTFGNRYLTWNMKADYKHLIAHATIVKLDCLFDNERELLDFIGRLQKKLHHLVEFRSFHFEEITPLTRYEKTSLLEAFPRFSSPVYFKLAYAIEALISRGGVIYDYFFHPKFRQFDKFVTTVETRYFEDELKVKDKVIELPRTLAVLEEMLTRIDHNVDITSPLELFEQIYMDGTLNLTSNLTHSLVKEGYMRVRRVIITPTRKIYVNPELVMGNRSLRSIDPDAMLRVSFRDENSRKMSSLPRAIINDTIKDVLTKPLKIGCQDYSYLGSSNSQLRDHGCYFIRGSDKDAVRFRASCGRFENQTISKMMARMGQVFTQSRRTAVVLNYREYTDICDFQGGSDSNNKPYTFSDGVGRISVDYIKRIVNDLQLGNCTPSVFQIRFRGYKGIVCKFNEIDRIREWAHGENLKDKKNNMNKLSWFDQSIMFRNSQKKFDAPLDEHLEIVKISTPINVNLNKPLINIMDQVSEKQGPRCHQRMKNRIISLLNMHIHRNIYALIDEVTAKIVLNEFTKYIHYELLEQDYVTEDPFFRSLLRATCAAQLKKLRDKMQIRVPRDLGRMMFGVVDETGLLQYGQVFFQYTINCDIKYPHSYTEKKIHVGPVMITKNPSVVPGDYRRFNAVDLPALHHLVDVVVFPQHGPRPHPDEMAGSDLDGDEYSLIWDELLFLDKNEPPFDFTAVPKEGVIVDPEDPQLTNKMAEFFVHYITQDTIGSIASAHLANSDLYGIYSDVCQSIAKKHNQAVDFPKSGQIPDELTRKWGSKGEPPERVERFPQFMPRHDASCYQSKRLLGVLYDEVTELAEMVGFESLMSENETVTIDNKYLVEGYEKYVNKTLKAFHEYKFKIEDLMHRYGIKNEGELFSGNYTALKLRLSDKDNDDMSLFNTAHMIGEQLAQICGKFREDFFIEFGGIAACTEIDNKLDFYGLHETFRRIVREPDLAMRQKASAYYFVSYVNKKCLSFAWLVSEILSRICKEHVVLTKKYSYSPLADKLNVKILQAAHNCADKFEAYFHSLQKVMEIIVPRERDYKTVAQACCFHIGLAELLFFIREWANLFCLNEKDLPREDLDLIVVLHGYGALLGVDGQWLSDKFDIEEDIAERPGGLGKIFLEIIQYFMSQSFGSLDELSLEDFYGPVINRAAIVDLSTAAHQTFYTIALNRKFNVIPGNDASEVAVFNEMEGMQLIFEIPKHSEYNYDEMLKKVALKCGCKQIARRRKPEKFNSTVHIISAQPVGSFQSLKFFRKLLMVKPSDNMSNLKERAKDITEQVLKKLVYYSQDNVAVTDPWPPTADFFNNQLETFQKGEDRPSSGVINHVLPPVVARQSVPAVNFKDYVEAAPGW